MTDPIPDLAALERAGRPGAKPGNLRNKKELHDFLLNLRANPEAWEVYSTHSSVPAARARMYQMRSSPKFVDLPMEFRVKRCEPGGVVAQIQARWDPSKAMPAAPVGRHPADIANTPTDAYRDGMTGIVWVLDDSTVLATAEWVPARRGVYPRPARRGEGDEWIIPSTWERLYR